MIRTTKAYFNLEKGLIPDDLLWDMYWEAAKFNGREVDRILMAMCRFFPKGIDSWHMSKVMGFTRQYTHAKMYFLEDFDLIERCGAFDLGARRLSRIFRLTDKGREKAKELLEAEERLGSTGEAGPGQTIRPI